MKFYVDLDIQKAVSGIGLRDAVSLVEFKRGDTSRIEVSYFRGSTVQELTEPTSGIFGIKEDGKYDGDYLVSDVTWAKEGTGTSTVYVFEPSFNTSELDAVLNANDADDTNDVEYVDAMMEISWIENGVRSSTQTIIARIYSDVIKESEGAPTPVEGVDEMIAARAVCYDRAQTLSNAQKEQAWANLGIAAYADLTAANAALAPGIPYYDRALQTLNISTA